ncbi:MAG: acylphosphatase, partial [Syntrophomonas sp.]
MNDRAYRIIIKGIVQGVGFRPYVYRLATEYSLTGWVLNSSAGVFMEVEGPEEALQSFLDKMQLSPPPLAVIRSCTMQAIDPVGYTDFTIKASDDRVEKTVMISPDIAICADCQREVQDHEDRHFEYPFTNCTNCGPRFTIIKDVPYDRAKTTMASFPMCSECQAEYENPL